ncbi:hypothetical protein BGX38DRAFT_610419 [Terfezia claveryi]|nr:hypothetical protein BGX38DRAFT_610419 [Terfezia claveryi]
MVKGTAGHGRREANAEFLEEQSPQLEGQPAAGQLAFGRTAEKAINLNSEVLQAGPLHIPGPSTQVVLNLTKGITPKVTKRPQSKTPRSKNSVNDSGEPRRRGGKRTACDACRKSRRKCAHGLDGTSLAAGPQAEDDAESDDDQSAREPTVILDGADETRGSVQGAGEASINADHQADEGIPHSEQATPSEQLLQESELLAQQLQQQQDLIQEIDSTQSMSPELVTLEDAVTSSRREASLEDTRESIDWEAMEAPENTMHIIANSAGRGKRKRVAETEEEKKPM